MKRNIQIVAHRGANNLAPENTMAAIRLCMDMGVDYIELDVRSSSDGVFYNFHDAILDRTTDGTGKLSERSSRYIDGLDAGCAFSGEFAGERVPKIGEILEAVRGKMKVFFDYKSGDPDRFLRLLRRSGMERDCFFWFGDGSHVDWFLKQEPRPPLKINASGPGELEKIAELYRPEIIETDVGDLSEEMVSRCHAMGLRIMANEKKGSRRDFRKILELGCDMINLNHPDLFLDEFNRFKSDRTV